MKAFIIVVAIACLPLMGYSQQDPLYAQYLINPFLLNPGYAGVNNNFSAVADYRKQWAGFDGSPQTFHASAHSSFRQNKLGAGVIFMSDKIGNLKTTETNLALAYKIDLTESTVSFGMLAGLQSFRADYSSLNIFDGSDLAFTGNERGTRFNVGAGAVWKSEKYIVGISAPRLLPTKFANGGQEFKLYDQHYYLTGSFLKDLSADMQLKPSVLLRLVKGAPPSIDGALNIVFKKQHSVGAFTRNFRTYGLVLQTLISERVRMGYVFEVPSDKSIGTRFTSHEIAIGVVLPTFSYHDSSVSNF